MKWNIKGFKVKKEDVEDVIVVGCETYHESIKIIIYVIKRYRRKNYCEFSHYSTLPRCFIKAIWKEYDRDFYDVDVKEVATDNLREAKGYAKNCIEGFKEVNGIIGTGMTEFEENNLYL